METAIQRLVEQFDKLPGIGPKNAERLAYFFLTLPDAAQQEFIASFTKAAGEITTCDECNNLSEKNPCPICTNPRRDKHILCIVPEYKELYAIERTGEYKGLYHIIGGVIAPLQGITPKDLDIHKMIERIKNDKNITEVILAINPNIEGETTMMYITALLKDLPVKITRLARGIPVGSEIEYIDEMTLGDALKERRAVK